MGTMVGEVKKAVVKAPFLTDKSYDRNNRPFEDKLILEPAYYFKNTFHYPDISKRLIKAFNRWIRASDEDFENNHEAATLCQLGHLIFNDILFDKKERNGKPTTHIKFGVPAIINTYFFTGLQYPTFVEKSLLKKALKTSNEESLKIFRIKYELINLRDRLICPNEELYYKCCGNRGSLSVLIMELAVLMDLYGQYDERIKNLATNIRIFLTIIDECASICNDICDDIIEGYFSFPIVHAIHNAVDDEEIIISIMRQRTTDEALLKTALKVVQGSGYEEAAKTKLKSLKDEILQDYKQFPKNNLLEKFFEDYLQIPENFTEATKERHNSL